jgi:hypothetical protein
VLGVAAAHATHGSVLVAGVAGLVAGAMSMAAGEYVSVHSQADSEEAELKLERTELKADDVGEHRELIAIYVARGLDPSLAKQVAEQLMAHNARGRACSRRTRHLRDPPCTSDSGCLGVGWLLRYWCSHAAVGHYHRSGGGADPSCLWNFTGVPRPSGRIGRARGRRRSNGGSDTSHVLGCTGHGANRRRRVVVRNSCVNRANGRPERLCSAYHRMQLRTEFF